MNIPGLSPKSKLFRLLLQEPRRAALSEIIIWARRISDGSKFDRILKEGWDKQEVRKLELKRTSPGHEAIRLDTVLEAVELPARIPYLDACLPDMDADDLPHLPPSCSTSEFMQPREFRSSYLHREEAWGPKRSAPLHTEEGRAAAGRRGRKEDKAA